MSPVRRVALGVLVAVQLATSLALAVLAWRQAALEVVLRRALYVLEGGCQ